MKNMHWNHILEKHALDGCLIEDPVDLLYLTGLSLSKGSLLLQKEGSSLFVDGRYLEIARKKSPFPVVEKEPQWPTGRIGFDSAFTSFDRSQILSKNGPQVQWVPLSHPLKDLRVCKTPHEISALKRASELTYAGYQHVRGKLREGVSEEELAFEFEFFCRKKGASSLSFESIIAFGANSAQPHHRAGKTLLKKNQIVLIDVGAVVDQYRGDMTRVVFFEDPDPKLLHLFEIVQRAQKKAVSAVRPGIKIGSLDEMVREEFRKEGVENLFIHSLGHGIGLETHEFPRIKWDGEDADVILKPGMVFTIEPGLYQPGLGGIRIEDMVLVTDSGYTNLCGTS